MADIKIRNIEPTDPQIISAAFDRIGWNKSIEQYQKYYEESQTGDRDVIVATHGTDFLGYGTIVWTPQYIPFKEKNIPEIQDLNVLPAFRRKGVASLIMNEAELRISKRTNVAGLGVGLIADYGSAQRMYVNRGYIPDGNGITYNYQVISYGDTVLCDDDLVLWFTKKLN
jgi:GNAT superfamily N-acetyltransferase